jgi:hypothetical protein
MRRGIQFLRVGWRTLRSSAVRRILDTRAQPARRLKIDDVRYVQETARRITAIVLLQLVLDANYEAVKKNTFAWPSK